MRAATWRARARLSYPCCWRLSTAVVQFPPCSHRRMHAHIVRVNGWKRAWQCVCAYVRCSEPALRSSCPFLVAAQFVTALAYLLKARWDRRRRRCGAA